MRAQGILCILATSLLWAVACSPGEGAPPARRFVPLDDARVRDSRTGLEWTRHDDGQGLDWNKAEAYCQALRIDDTKGWRLPGIEELRTLYGVTPKRKCGDAMCAIDLVFTLTSPYVWTDTSPTPGSRIYLDFQFGSQLSPWIEPHLTRSVLCVRTSAASAAKQPVTSTAQ